LLGCGAQAPAPADDLEVVEEGKGDDYYSPTAREYYVEGSSTVQLEDALVGQSAELKLARARELMSLKTIEVGWFLHVRLIDKEVTFNDPKHTDPNAKTYPGFHAIVRDGQYMDQGLVALPDGKSYSFKVRLQVAGQKDLIARLPGTAIDATHKKFTLQMGKVSNADLARLDAEHEWFRDPQWDSGRFDPSKLSASQLEPIELVISPQPAAPDAWLDSNKLFADGKLTIDVHYGWDYWSRYDVSSARDLYETLVARGFHAPAPFVTYDGSAPLVRTITAHGKPVAVEVRIYHGKDDKTAGADPDTDEGGAKMEAQMYASLADRDVIVFSGHSGNYYGFALANWNKTARGALDYPQLSSAQLPANRYQVVLASGCDTFSIGQAFRDNASKPGLANLNVITTNSFSDAGSNDELYALLDALYAHESAGSFSPVLLSTMLSAMNDHESIGAMFGLHGVDGDPHLHPFADVSKLGAACTRSADCGGDGNSCATVAPSAGQKVCAPACTADAACPAGYRCRLLGSRSTATLVGRGCVQ
jgi:hypothetical protein